MIKNEREYFYYLHKLNLLKISHRLIFEDIGDSLFSNFLNMTEEIEKMLKEYDEYHYSDRIWPWIPTGNDGRYWPNDPRPGDFDIVDIANTLAYVNRFGGKLKFPYSVALHSILVSRALPKHLKMFGLMHDASEAYLGDVITPVKKLVGGSYTFFENKTMIAIAKQFGFYNQLINKSDYKAVEKVDKQALTWEYCAVAKTCLLDIEVAPFNIIDYPRLFDDIDLNMKPDDVAQLFLNEFKKINGEQPV